MHRNTADQRGSNAYGDAQHQRQPVDSDERNPGDQSDRCSENDPEDEIDRR
jgi:hypothetical protein